MSKITLNNVSNLDNKDSFVTVINSNSAIIQTAMDNTLSRDGTIPNQMTANLDMNSKQIINLPNPATANSPLRLQDLSTFIGGGTIGTVPAGGTTNSILTKHSNTDYDMQWSAESLEVLPGINISITGTSPITVATVPNPNFATSVTTPSLVLNGNTAGGITGTGNLVAATSATMTTPTITSPTLVTPVLGAATATTINKITITQPATGATLTIPDTVVLTGPAASGTAMTLGNTETVTGVKTFGSAGAVGRFKLAGTTSGTTVVDATAVASGTVTIPAATDTLVGKATTDTLTNKTYDTAGTGNSFSINGVAANANTGTGSVVRATTPTLVTPVLGAATATTINAVSLDNNAWTTYTPTSAWSTPGTSVMGASNGRFKQIGKLVWFTADCTCTTVGTGTGSWNVGLPTASFSSSFIPVVTGKEVITLGVLVAVGGLTTTVISVNKFDNTSLALGGNGTRINIGGFYEAA